MILLGDVGHVESPFFHLETVLVSDKIGARFAPNVPSAQKSFWTHPLALVGDRFKWKPVSVHLVIVLILTQDWCTVCAEHTRGLEIILDAPDDIPS
jgi:hypothetical protein